MDYPLFFNPEIFQKQKVTEPFHNTFSCFEVKEKMGLTFLLNPALVPYQGFIAQPDDSSNTYTAYSFYKKSIDAFCNELPKFDALILTLDPMVKYILPFIWQGFEVKTRYTFKLDLQIENLQSNYKESLKREIRKAEKSITIESSDAIDELFLLKQLNQKALKSPLDFDLQYLKDFYFRFKSHNAGALVLAKIEEQVIGALFYVWNEKSAYYLAGAVHPDYRNSGALSLLLNEAITKSKVTSQYFDFEGSMEAGIARYFASFGAQAEPFYQIEKYPNKIAEAALKAKKMLG